MAARPGNQDKAAGQLSQFTVFGEVPGDGFEADGREAGHIFDASRNVGTVNPAAKFGDGEAESFDIATLHAARQRRGRSAGSQNRQ